MRERDPIVVTGVGAVSAYGWGTAALRYGLASGTTSVARPRRFDTAGHRTHLAAEVPEPPSGQPPEDRGSRADLFAVAAAVEACTQAGFEPRDHPAGVYFGGSTAAMAEGEEYFAHLAGHLPGRPRLAWLGSHQLDGPGAAVARRLGITGPVETLSSACASGGLAIGAALDALRLGEVEVAIAGGSDSLCRLTYAGFNSLRAVDEAPCRPFRPDRAGLSLGEGAGVLVLERLSHAEERGARPLATLLGAGASCDAHHMTAPHPHGVGAARALEAALRDAGVDPAGVDFVNAHGTGTAHNDVSEARALARVFGERTARLPVTSTKGGVGHLLGSSGALEAVATVLCLLAAEVHPTPGDGEADAELGVDLVLGRPRPVPEASTAVSTSFAFGGANAALVFAAVPPREEWAEVPAWIESGVEPATWQPSVSGAPADGEEPSG